MAQTYKVLGQVYPAGSTDTTLYTVPAATQTVSSTINVCNQASSSATFRVSVRPLGATLNNQHYLSYETPIPAYDSIPLTLGITLGATDVVTVRSSNGSISFSIFGSEVI
jgi:hypothetical protein